MNIFSLNIGRLHPILVHLPIGFLILTLLLVILNRRFKEEGYEKAIEIGLLVSFLASIATVATGLILAEQKPYDSSLTIHKWFGILTSVFSLVLYLGQTNKVRLFRIMFPYLVPLTLLAVGVTGHLGGSLTHGSNFLFTYPSDITQKSGINSDAEALGHIVEIKQFKYVPNFLEVNIGDTITFVNRDFVPHDVTEETMKAWTSSTLNSGDSWSMIAEEDVNYFCSLHIVMKGKIRIAN